MPEEAESQIQELWDRSLPRAGAETMAHFYLPGGLNYESMDWVDRFLMWGLATLLKNKQDLTEDERRLKASISASFDISAPAHPEPLISWVQHASEESRC